MLYETKMYVGLFNFMCKKVHQLSFKKRQNLVVVYRWLNPYVCAKENQKLNPLTKKEKKTKSIGQMV